MLRACCEIGLGKFRSEMSGVAYVLAMYRGNTCYSKEIVHIHPSNSGGECGGRHTAF